MDSWSNKSVAYYLAISVASAVNRRKHCRTRAVYNGAILKLSLNDSNKDWYEKYARLELSDKTAMPSECGRIGMNHDVTDLVRSLAAFRIVRIPV